MNTPNMTKLNRAVADLYELGAENAVAALRDVGETWSTDRTERERLQLARDVAVQQAAALRTLASAIERTGIPASVIARPLMPDTWELAGETADKQDVVRKQVRVVSRMLSIFFPHVKQDKAPYDTQWGIGALIAPHVKFQRYVDNEVTCEYVPKTDENGEPITETKVIEAVEARVEEVPVMDRKCISLFGGD